METDLSRQPAWQQQWHTPFLARVKTVPASWGPAQILIQVQVFTGQDVHHTLEQGNEPELQALHDGERLGILLKEYSSHIAPH